MSSLVWGQKKYKNRNRHASLVLCHLAEGATKTDSIALGLVLHLMHQYHMTSLHQAHVGSQVLPRNVASRP